MLLVEQNATAALDLADHAYLIETGQSRHGRARARHRPRRERSARLSRLLTRAASMELFLHQVLAGVATGGIYACMALAIVMIYQAIDSLNFAQGEMAMFSTFIAWQLMQWGLPYWVAFFATIAFSFVAGVVIERVVFKPIRNAPVAQPHRGVHRAVRHPQQPGGLHLGLSASSRFPSPFGARPSVRQRPDQRARRRHDRGHADLARAALFFLPLHAHRPCHARGGSEPRIGAARRHPRRLDGGARLGHGGCDRRRRRHADRARRVPRTEHDARHPALRLRRALLSAASTARSAPSSAAFLSASSKILPVPSFPYVGRELKLTIALALIVAVLTSSRADCSAEPLSIEPSVAMANTKIRTHRSCVCTRPGLARDLASAHLRCRRGRARCMLLPFVVKNFFVFQLTLAMVYAIAILGLNLLTGFNGQFSLGHSRLLRDRRLYRRDHDGPVGRRLLLDACRPPALPASSSASCSACRRCGSKASISRWRRFALAVATAADSQVDAARALDRRRAGHRHHQAGCAVRPAVEPRSMALFLHPRGRCWRCMLAPHNLVDSRTGRAHHGDPRQFDCRERRWASTCRSTKSLTFGVSALYTGVAGALGAIVIQFVAPDSFTFALVDRALCRPRDRRRRLDRGHLVWRHCSFCSCRISPNSVSKGLAGAVYGVILILAHLSDAVRRRRTGATDREQGRASGPLAREHKGGNTCKIAYRADRQRSLLGLDAW